MSVFCVSLACLRPGPSSAAGMTCSSIAQFTLYPLAFVLTKAQLIPIPVYNVGNADLLSFLHLLSPAYATHSAMTKCVCFPFALLRTRTQMTDKLPGIPGLPFS